MAGEGRLQVVVDRAGLPSSAADAPASTPSKPSLQVIVLVSRLFSLVFCLSNLIVSPSITPHKQNQAHLHFQPCFLLLPTKVFLPPLRIPSLGFQRLLEAVQPAPTLASTYHVWDHLDRLLFTLAQKD